MVGNPTNPTAVLHPAEAIRALGRPGRVVVVDEAFADALPGEPESLAGADVPGLLVFRSLTKTWALAGLRAGYALGAPALLARLARPRPPWPVSTLALEAVAACCAPEALDAARRAAEALVRRRAAQAAALAAVPGVTVLPGVAPYLLLRLPDGQGSGSAPSCAPPAWRCGAATRSRACRRTTCASPSGPPRRCSSWSAAWPRRWRRCPRR